MTTAISQPSGDSHGGLDEVLVPLRLKPHRLRSLRERQLALLVVCAGALVAILDGTAVYVALPDIQRSLDLSPTTLAWVVNGYLLPFGGLLLMAGKLGDTIGAKRVFVGGLALFMAASAVCGLAESPEVLITARFFQGAGGALSTAVVIGMIVTMFPKPRERTRALAMYAFVASSGAALGLLAGAGLTAWLSWQWIFFVNLPIGALTIVGSLVLLDNIPQAARDRESVDWFGAITMVSGLTLTVYTIAQSAEYGWGSPRTLLLGGGSVLLLATFVAWQARARHPLVPLSLLSRGNVGRSNLVLALMVAGPAAMFFLVSLYLRNVLGFTVLESGLGFLPAVAAVGVASLKTAPWLLRRMEAKTLLAPSILLLAIGLLLLARIPADGSYVVDVLPAVFLLGSGAGLATPPVLQLALAGSTSRDSGVRSGLLNTTQQIGSALGLAILAPVAASGASDALLAGQPVDEALTTGYRIAFLVGLVMTLLALVLAVVFVRSEAAVSVSTATRRPATGVGPRRPAARRRDETGAEDADFLAIGMGGTGMMAMLWSIAMGRRAVGVDLRGDPFVNLMHWSVSVDTYHHLALVDKLMMERYGEDRIPRLENGKLFLLHECFYRTNGDGSSGARVDEIFYGWEPEGWIAGLARSLEVVDDRWVDGEPQRSVTSRAVPEVSEGLDMGRVGRGIDEVLGEPLAFLVPAEELLILMRRYLEEIERMDLAAGVTPRCRMFLYHQVARAKGARRSRSTAEPGFRRGADGRVSVQIEAVEEVDNKNRFQRTVDTNLGMLDLGVPELVMIAEGAVGVDAARLGFRQEPVMIDRGDGRGPVPAQADYIFGLLGVYVNNHDRRRISSMFDEDGNEHWVRQSVIGHEDYSESAWTMVQVPDFMRFDPSKEGVVGRFTSSRSAAYFGGYRHLVREFHLEQAAELTGLTKSVLAGVQSLATPRLCSTVSRIGVDALLAPNVVVAGDSFGTSSCMSVGPASTGIVGHAARVLRYWEVRAEGTEATAAARMLADRIKQDTATFVRLANEDFVQPPARATGGSDGVRSGARREKTLEDARRHRRAIARFDPLDDWSRLVTFPGRLHMPGMTPVEGSTPESRSSAGGAAQDREADERVGVDR